MTAATISRRDIFTKGDAYFAGSHYGSVSIIQRGRTFTVARTYPSGAQKCATFFSREAAEAHAARY